ncbi:F-box only protein 15-like isoform X2 [Gadus chalcogrammus]|uniref:F-box only protein 15-like isoform X2 n=1 Tax=Gadus chalcogrammus TaxID=1042646 RepID=UPI0024C4826C|nr:F-box only protein 15-like isoform X2 [Gadus chalcogrammus]
MSKQKATISSKPELRRTKGEKSSSKTPKQCLIQRLPLEVLGKILHYLDASSLFCISHVNKFFNRLANDDIIWLKLYVSEIGEGKVWRPKGPVENTVPERSAAFLAGAEVPRRAPGHWKRRYLKERAGYNVSEWLRDLRAVSPYTGLPSQTESLLRKRRVSWELTVTPRSGREAAFQQSQVHFFQSSVTVCWSHSSWPSCSQVASLQVHAVVRVALACPSLQRPGWRSLLGSFDAEALSERSPLVGHDALVKVLVLQGLLVGVWRGTTSIAFVIACFHFHRLVERSLLGSSICPYSGAVNKAPFDDIDPEYGLHGYTLHMVLHNTVAEIMSGQFSQLFCRKAQIQNGHIELVAISRAVLSQHTPLTGNISLPWRCEGLEGTLENCCLMSFTLLDEALQPFWCLSSPVHLAPAKKPGAYDYDGEHFSLSCLRPEGRVAMELVRTERQRQLFLIDLRLYVGLQEVNRHFGKSY